MSQLVKHLPLVQVITLGPWDRALSWAPCSAGDIISPSAPAHVLSLTHSVPQINEKNLKKKTKKTEQKKLNLNFTFYLF